MKLIISNKFANSRLDKSLSLLIPTHSKNFFKQKIEQNLVSINNKIEYKANYKVQQGDIISIDISSSSSYSKLTKSKKNLNIIFEDNDILVVNKQAGIAVHPSQKNLNDTILNRIAFHLTNYNLDMIRSGLINRLDKNTSGLLLFAKNNLSRNYYANLFAQKKVNKTYIAVIETKNNIIDTSLAIKKYLKPTINKIKKMKICSKGEKFSKFSHTIFTKTSEKNGYTTLTANLKTGKKHQIRVHLASIGSPIVGDKLYGGKNFERMLLHSYKLEFIDRFGKKKKFITYPDFNYK